MEHSTALNRMCTVCTEKGGIHRNRQTDNTLAVLQHLLLNQQIVVILKEKIGSQKSRLWVGLGKV